ncbi:vitamin K epoxide reductase family protein [Candidatus Uhrbacteria bacterium]|nr:vitamin K epoxide reductase family protein [Candidatus Uhrbacteria bacterium]
MSAFIINIFLGFVGFLISLYIAHKKRRKTEAFVCPFRGNCTEVIHSDFSKFLGIPVEWLGLFFYAAVALGFGARALWPAFDGSLIVPLLFMTTFAVIFSFYLTFIEVVTLRKLCTWCLISASLSLGIFVITLFSSVHTIVPFLITNHSVIFIAHVTGMAIGLGSATLADLFFIKFLKDFRISNDEASILRICSQVIWFSIGLVVMTGLGLYLPNGFMFAPPAQELMRLIVVGVIVFNGAFLNLFITPKLLNLHFGKSVSSADDTVHTRQIAFALGPISIVSWYAAFILTLLDRPPASFEIMWRVYAVLLVLSIIFGQFAEVSIQRRASKSS